MYLREKHFSIQCLQDTHFTEKEEIFIRAQWGYNIYASHGTGNSRGVAILLNNNFEVNIMKQTADNAGNMIMLEMEVEKNTLFY